MPVLQQKRSESIYSNLIVKIWSLRVVTKLVTAESCGTAGFYEMVIWALCLQISDILF